MILAVTAVAVGACAQWTAGFGFALICGPLLIATLGQTAGLQLILTLSTLISVAMLAGSVRDLKWRDAVLLAAPGVVLTPVLVAALRGVDKGTLTLAAGLLTLAATAVLARGVRVARLRGTGGAAAAGVVSAAMNVVGGLSGPLAALYAVNAGWRHESIRPTLQVFGILLNISALLSLGGVNIDWRAGVALMVGGLAGAVLARRLSSEASRRLVLTIAALGGLYAAYRGLSS